MEKIKYLLLIVACQSILGCNVVHLKERLLKRSIRQNGLVKRQVQLGSDHVSYWEGGTGPTLVLLHGFGADGTWGWSEQIPALAKHFHLVVPDLLWFGQSSSSKPDFTVDHQVHALRKLLGHIGVHHYDIAGISYGGVIALSMMAEAPRQVNRAIMISSPGPVYTRDDYQAMLERFKVDSATQIVMPTTPQGLDRLMEIAYRKPPYVPAMLKQNVINFVKDGPGQERAALLAQLVDNLEMLKMKVRNIPERVLIIWGSDDRLFPLEVGLRFHNYLGPNGQIRVVDGGRHALNIEFPREVNRAMLDFLL